MNLIIFNIYCKVIKGILVGKKVTTQNESYNKDKQFFFLNLLFRDKVFL